jgi:hypothetical protein
LIVPAGAISNSRQRIAHLCGLAFGQIQLRKIDGHKVLPSFITKECQKVA